MRKILQVVLLSVLFATPLLAQDHGEVGVFADYLRISQVDTNNVGLGGRLGVRVFPAVHLEGEMMYDFGANFTESFTNPLNGNFTVSRTSVSVLHGLFGPKFQAGRGAFRAFATVKGGFINFRFNSGAFTVGNAISSVQNLRTTNTDGVLYPGGGVEAFLGPFGLRLDVGDEIYFSNGAHNNLRIAFGPHIRF